MAVNKAAIYRCVGMKKRNQDSSNPEDRLTIFHSIRAKYTILMAALMGIMILVICLANSLYLEKYYISEKAKAMVTVFEQLDDILEEQTLSNTAVQQEVLRLFESSNISAIVLDTEQDAIWKFGYGNRIEEQMKDMIYGNEINRADIIEQTDQYIICRWTDLKLETGYILFWGFMDNEGFCFMRTSLPGLRESAAVSTKFAWMIGIAAILFSIISISFLSKHISEPIIRLASIANRMAQLDFSVHCMTERNDEIGVLGKSMNYMSAELEKTIHDLRQANEQLQRDIKEKEKIEEMRKEFISNISHELKTPIALIQGYAEGLLEGISDDPESMEYYCEVIVDEAGKMNQLVRKLMTLNQLEAGVSTVEMVDFDLNEMMAGVLHSFNIILKQKGITVQYELDHPVRVRADEFLMEEVVRNYISNAINHIGGQKMIRIYLEEDDSQVKVSVWNTGTPIPDDSLDKVWIKFYKVDKAHTRSYGGSGVGLSIVKAAMDVHGGACGVYNTDNGVCFWFSLSKLALPAVIGAVGPLG